MPKRLRDLILGTEDAMPGDYVLALIATLALIVAVVVDLAV